MRRSGDLARTTLTAVAMSAVVMPTGIGLHAATPTCDTTPTGGLVLHSPYVDQSVVASLPAGAKSLPRSYLLFVPPGLPDRPVPLVLSMHGLGGNGAQHAMQTDWPNFFTTEAPGGAIVAFPNGPVRWDTRPGSSDVQFMRDVVSDIRVQRCIDPSRIYAVGHSNGAFMAERLACDAGDVFAAVAAYAGGNIDGNLTDGGPCNAGTDAAGAPPNPPGYLPMPVGMWHGTADSVEDYRNDLTGQRQWLQRYDCDTTPVATTSAGSGLVTGGIATGLVYGRCARPDVAALGRPPLLFQALPGHDHGWPDGCGGAPVSDAAGSDTCTPNGTFPTADGFDGVVWTWLSSWTRPQPAAVESVLAPTPAVGAFLPDPQNSSSGADNTVVTTVTPAPASDGLVQLSLPPGATLRVSVRLDVATSIDPLGVGPDHPLCPTASPGPSTQAAVGKSLLVSLGDGTAGRTSSVTVTTVRDGTGARADADLVVPRPPYASPLAIRVSYAGDPVRTWEACGLPPIWVKETTTRS